MSNQTETADVAEVGGAVSYSALEHTVTVDGGWPTCAGCGEPGSHEACIDEQWPTKHQQGTTDRGRAGQLGARRPCVVFNPDAVRAWLSGEDPDEPGQQRAERYLYLGEDPEHAAVVLDDAERLVDEAGRAELFGPDMRIGLWLDREPADAGPAVGWHLTVEIATAAPSGDLLRFAGTWAETSMLHSSTHDPSGIEGLVAVLAAVAADATGVLDRSLTAIAALYAPAVEPGVDRRPHHAEQAK